MQHSRIADISGWKSCPFISKSYDLKCFSSSEEPISLLFVVINVKNNHCKLHLKRKKKKRL